VVQALPDAPTGTRLHRSRSTEKYDQKLSDAKAGTSSADPAPIRDWQSPSEAHVSIGYPISTVRRRGQDYCMQAGRDTDSALDSKLDTCSQADLADAAD
jgi:hypothetical protein